MTITIYDESLKAREYSQGKAIADAAVSVGASYIIFSTQARPSTLSGGRMILDSLEVKAEIEDYIRSLPIKSAFFAPGGFMQNYTGHSAPRPLGEEPVATPVASPGASPVASPVLEPTPRG